MTASISSAPFARMTNACFPAIISLSLPNKTVTLSPASLGRKRARWEILVNLSTSRKRKNLDFTHRIAIRHLLRHIRWIANCFLLFYVKMGGNVHAYSTISAPAQLTWKWGKQNHFAHNKSESCFSLWQIGHFLSVNWLEKDEMWHYFVAHVAFFMTRCFPKDNRRPV